MALDDLSDRGDYPTDPAAAFSARPCVSSIVIYPLGHDLGLVLNRKVVSSDRELIGKIRIAETCRDALLRCERAERVRGGVCWFTGFPLAVVSDTNKDCASVDVIRGAIGDPADNYSTVVGCVNA